MTINKSINAELQLPMHQLKVANDLVKAAEDVLRTATWIWLFDEYGIEKYVVVHNHQAQAKFVILNIARLPSPNDSDVMFHAQRLKKDGSEDQRGTTYIWLSEISNA